MSYINMMRSVARRAGAKFVQLKDTRITSYSLMEVEFLNETVGVFCTPKWYYVRPFVWIIFFGAFCVGFLYVRIHLKA